jgi:putative ABC transport system substrate-binding protein
MPALVIAPAQATPALLALPRPVSISDPVQIGLVHSLNRPGGNLTGLTLLSVELGPKLLELLHDAIPSARTMALLINPTNPNSDTETKTLQVRAAMPPWRRRVRPALPAVRW